MADVYSIVVPTFNRASALTRNVRSLLTQETASPYEIIVVDNNSTDGTREKMRALAARAPEKLRYMTEHAQGVSAARNAGVLAARGGVIAFIDDDAVAHPGWLNALAQTYRVHADAWCVGGKIALDLPDALPQWFGVQPDLLRGHLGHLDLGDTTIELSDSRDVFGGNFSVRREVFDRVGFFDISLGLADRRRVECDEVELCWRIRQAGGRIYYCGEAVVSHIVPESRLTTRFFRNRAYWRGRTAGLIGRKDLFVVRPPHLVRSLLRLVISRIISLFDSRAINESRVFSDELECWRRLGYLQQSLLARLGRCRNVRPKTTGMPTHLSRHQVGR